MIVEQIQAGAWDRARQLVRAGEVRGRVRLGLWYLLSLALVVFGFAGSLDRSVAAIAALGFFAYGSIRFAQTRVRVEDVNRSETLAGVMTGSIAVVSDREWTPDEVDLIAEQGFKVIDLPRELATVPPPVSIEDVRSYVLTAVSWPNRSAIRIPTALADTDELSASLLLTTTIRRTAASLDVGDLHSLVGDGVAGSPLLYRGDQEGLFLAGVRSRLPPLRLFARNPRSRIVVLVDSSRRDALHVAVLAAERLKDIVVRGTAQPELIQQDQESWPSFVLRRQLKLALAETTDVILAVGESDTLLASFRSAVSAGSFAAVIWTDRCPLRPTKDVAIRTPGRTAQEVSSDVSNLCERYFPAPDAT
ncbi:MAG: hypothetical protein KDB16_01585 [Acidimicrobiales bacterium]|nr:hypothetical protein [Acidimicrobiales bacterium]